MPTRVAIAWFVATLAIACEPSSVAEMAPVDASDAVGEPTPLSCGEGATFCPSGALDAGRGHCVALLSDPANCGQCGAACPQAFYCAGGHCIDSCTPPAVRCSASQCSDLSIDPANCGRCGRACADGNVCSNGFCVDLCTAPSMRCGDSCVDVQHDPLNCGACGNRCPDSSICLGAGCASVCGVGLSRCERSCVDFQTDPAHCGSCDTVCASGACTAGVCDCVTGTHCGDGRCHDLETELANCGACDSPCVEGASCAAGTCRCATGSRICGLACVDTAVDELNCGSCGTECAMGSMCVSGACTEASSWRIAGGDPSRTRWNVAETGHPPATLAWSTAAGPTLAEEAIESNGRVVVYRTSSLVSNGLEALDLADGHSLWTHSTGTVMNVAYTFDGGDVLFADSSLFELDRLDGSNGVGRWSAPFGMWPGSTAAVVTAGGVAFGGGIGAFERDGRTRFAFPFENEVLGVFRNHLYAGHTTISSINPRSGAAVALFSTGINAWDSIAFDDAAGYLFDRFDHELIRFDPSSGSISWHAEATGVCAAPAIGPSELYWVANSQLRAIDPATGGTTWTFAGDLALEYPPAGAAGYVYVASSATVFAVDLVTHTSVWSATPGGRLSIAAGHLFVSGADGILRTYALAP